MMHRRKAGFGGVCPVHTLAPAGGGLMPAAAAPAASPQRRAPASTAVGHSRAPGGGERHAPSRVRDTARCPDIAGIPRSRDAPSPDQGNGSRRAPIRDRSAPASRSLSCARLPQDVVLWEISRRRMTIHRVSASPPAPVHAGPAESVSTRVLLGRPCRPCLGGASGASGVTVPSAAASGGSSEGR